MRPPAGSGVVRSTRARASAAWLARSAWWSWAHRAQGRPGAARSRSAAVGQPPQRSESQPWPSSQVDGSVTAAWAARIHESPALSVAASDRSTWCVATAALARCRCASVNPGSATSSGSRAIRSVNGSARVSRSTSEPAKATRPSRIPMASTQPKPDEPASVAIRPVMSVSSGIGQGVGSASSAVSPSRSSPAPRPSANATRALTAHRCPTGSAPARTHIAPPPGNA